MSRAAGVIMRDLYMENLFLPAATMCINVQKPGVPDSVEQKRALWSCITYVVQVSCKQFYTLNYSGLKPISCMDFRSSEYSVRQCASDEIWRIKKKNYILLLDLSNLWCSHWMCIKKIQIEIREFVVTKIFFCSLSCVFLFFLFFLYIVWDIRIGLLRIEFLENYVLEHVIHKSWSLVAPKVQRSI